MPNAPRRCGARDQDLPGSQCCLEPAGLTSGRRPYSFFNSYFSLQSVLVSTPDHGALIASATDFAKDTNACLKSFCTSSGFFENTICSTRCTITYCSGSLGFWMRIGVSLRLF